MWVEAVLADAPDLPPPAQAAPAGPAQATAGAGAGAAAKQGAMAQQQQEAPMQTPPPPTCSTPQLSPSANGAPPSAAATSSSSSSKAAPYATGRALFIIPRPAGDSSAALREAAKGEKPALTPAALATAVGGGGGSLVGQTAGGFKGREICMRIPLFYWYILWLCMYAVRRPRQRVPALLHSREAAKGERPAAAVGGAGAAQAQAAAGPVGSFACAWSLAAVYWGTALLGLFRLCHPS